MAPISRAGNFGLAKRGLARPGISGASNRGLNSLPNFMPELLGARGIANFKLKPDPNRVPVMRTPEERFKDAQPKTGTIEDFQLYENQVAPNNIDALLPNGFKLESGARVVSEPGRPLGLLLLEHEAFEIDLSEGVHNLERGRVDFDPVKVLGVLRAVHPKPELLVIGLGVKTRVLGPATQKIFRELGIQTEIATTRSAASSYSMLAGERGKTVGALLLPPNI